MPVTSTTFRPRGGAIANPVIGTPDVIQIPVTAHTVVVVNPGPDAVRVAVSGNDTPIEDGGYLAPGTDMVLTVVPGRDTHLHIAR